MPNNGYWQGNPVNLDISRSKFNMPHRWTGTFQPGVLVPIFANSDILPGDTMKMDVSSVIRSITPIVPVMDDAYLDLEAYFVPHKLTLSRKYMSPDVNDSNHSFAAMMGAQDSLLNMPLPQSGVTLPAMAVDTDPTNYVKGGLADCLGYPTGESGQGVYFVNPLEVLAYYSVWNEYWREPNLQVPVTYSITTDQHLPGFDLLEVVDSVNNGTTYKVSSLNLMPVSRFHGYFGSALPWPQRNSAAVTVPLGDLAPVVTGYVIHSDELSSTPLKWANASNGVVAQQNGPLLNQYSASTGSWTGIKGDGTTGTLNNPGAIPANLYADLANASAISINALRYLFATQKYYEALARGGNRLEEMSEALFGTRPHDAAADIPEYLGGKRIPLGMTQVNSTAGGTTAAVSQATLGSTGAFSLTNSSDYLFTKSFDTWGTVIVVACVRVKDSFSQGIARRHRRFKVLDFYNPKFANIGEQPIYCEELLVHKDDETDISLSDLNGVSGDDQRDPDSGNRYIFGYQEAWAEYRYMPDIVTGEVKPGASMAYWTYANYFDPSENPTLKGFLNAKDQYSNFDRTLQVSSQTAGFTFIGQFLFDLDMVRPMPLYSIPGLIDHH